ncbi:MAG: hypothetical protein MPJ24_02660, partial [Pirellulaceae bacterium]|nr:hypothetical protein [Pirellulaceae bacterium]
MTLLFFGEFGQCCAPSVVLANQDRNRKGDPSGQQKKNSDEIDLRTKDAVEVYKCDFENESDLNYDGWPDGWTRKRGVGYPAYIDIGIVNPNKKSRKKKDAPSEQLFKAFSGERCLKVEMDGGAAMLQSKPVSIGSFYSYVLETSIRTEGLEHDLVGCALLLFDENGELLERRESEDVRVADDWKKVTVGPFTPENTEVRTAVVSLYVKPTKSADLTGKIWFDDIWLARLPRMELTANSPHHVYEQGNEITVTCGISGILEAHPMIRFELTDVNGKMIDEKILNLDGKEIQDETTKSTVKSNKVLQRRVLGNDKIGNYAGTIPWTLPIKEAGFYRVRVTMQGSTEVVHERMITLAVFPPHKRNVQGQFGWTLPKG